MNDLTTPLMDRQARLFSKWGSMLSSHQVKDAAVLLLVVRACNI
jgi:hypothetical protein